MEQRGDIAIGVMLVAGLIGGALWWRSDGSAPALPSATDLSTMDPQVASLIRSHRSALAAAPRDEQRLRALGLVYEANGLYTEAAACYHALAEWRPRDRDAWYRLARTQESAGDLAGAIDAMERAVALDPGFTEGFALGGWWLVEAGRFDEAEAMLCRARELAPENETALLGYALLLLERREANAAATLIRERALLERSNGQYAWRLLADAHRQLGRSAEAAAAMARAGQSRPKWPDVHALELDSLKTGRWHRTNEAKRLRDEGDHKGAVSILVELRRDHPDNVEVLRSLATCYIEMRRYPEAVDTIADALRLRPGGYGTNLVAAAAFLAVGRARPDAFERALTHAGAAANVRPAIAEPQLARAHALIGLGRRQDAITALLHAADLDGRDATALNQAGLLAWELGRYTDALDAFRRAEARDRSSATPLAGQALVLVALRQTSEAETLLREALLRRQDHPELVALVRRKLAESREGDG